jgi:hypothetical protein
MGKPNRAAKAAIARKVYKRADAGVPKLTFRVTDSLKRDFKAACGRRGMQQDTAGVEALRLWANPPLPANDNCCDHEMATGGEMVIAFGAVALSGALIGGFAVYAYFTWLA